ncbi:uncharacterized protein LOC143024258 [Oratosquilla oratoria]|uniref:uncharacterized protein LOC143024258 n=1 Tax=Oratosquilla oratoria TaxID=337810 RepID=UPI003F7653F4
MENPTPNIDVHPPKYVPATDNCVLQYPAIEHFPSCAHFRKPTNQLVLSTSKSMVVNNYSPTELLQNTQLTLCTLGTVGLSILEVNTTYLIQIMAMSSSYKIDSRKNRFSATHFQNLRIPSPPNDWLELNLHTMLKISLYQLHLEKFVIIPMDLNQCDKENPASKNLQLLLIVPSSPNHRSARKAIRDGWGSTLPHHWLMLFYVGRPSHYEDEVSILFSLCELLPYSEETNDREPTGHNQRKLYSCRLPSKFTNTLTSWKSSPKGPLHFVSGISPMSIKSNYFITLPQQKHLQDEARNYNDIIMDNFQDSYKNLTLKTLASLHWLLQHCPKVPYILKIDDDVLLNVRALQRLLNCLQYARTYTYGRHAPAQPEEDWPLGLNVNIVQQIENPIFPYCAPWNSFELISYFINSKTKEYESYIFGGYVYQKALPFRNTDSKWYLSTTHYAEGLLPTFLSGTSYILSTNLLPHLLQTAYKTPIIPLEDVYISGILGSKRLNLRLSHIEGWNNFRPHWESLCHLNTLVTVHGYQPKELLQLSKALGALNSSDCRGYIIYFTNWLNSLFLKVFPKYK